jgi:hypothetical protein
MRWYVNERGETKGPFEEEQVRAFAKANKLEGCQVREEEGGAWLPAKQSPFGVLMKERGWTAPIVAGVAVGGAGAALFGMLGAAAGFIVTFVVLALVRRL